MLLPYLSLYPLSWGHMSKPYGILLAEGFLLVSDCGRLYDEIWESAFCGSAASWCSLSWRLSVVLWAFCGSVGDHWRDDPASVTPACLAISCDGFLSRLNLLTNSGVVQFLTDLGDPTGTNGRKGLFGDGGVLRRGPSTRHWGKNSSMDVAILATRAASGSIPLAVEAGGRFAGGQKG